MNAPTRVLIADDHALFRAGVRALLASVTGSVFAAMRAGARGYVLKGAGQDEFLRAITAVAAGEALYDPTIARRIVQFFNTSRRDLPLNVFPDLTDREREILDLIASGHSNPVISNRLGISDKTVRNHITNIFSKLQVTDRVQAVMRARSAGFGHRDE